MAIVEQLMEASEADIDVLRSLDEQGDDFKKFREVDFLIEAPDSEKAETICGFINDFHYGRAVYEGEIESLHRVIVYIEMPVTQHIITSVSGFLICVASLFGGNLNGWGCRAQNRA